MSNLFLKGFISFNLFEHLKEFLKEVKNVQITPKIIRCSKIEMKDEPLSKIIGLIKLFHLLITCY